MPTPIPDKIFITQLDPIVVAIIEARLQINVPPAGFDPLNATAQQLAEYHLPPRPDAVLAPRSYELWAHAMSPPLAFVAVPQILAQMLGGVHSRSRHAQSSASGIVQESSQNWSGTYVRPRGFSPMVLVQGEWTVPAASAPAGSGDGTYASSIWVGLDGHEAASRSLPQVGTGQYVTMTGGAAQPLLFAWWQWWDRDDPHAQQIVLKNFPVKARDRIYAQIQALTPTLVSVFLKNMRTGLALPMSYAAPPPVDRGVNILPVRVEGRTADWIVERPAIPNTQPPQPYVLANFGNATFRACNAASGMGLTLNEEQLQRSRLIEMNVWDEPAHPGTLVSLPARVNRHSVRVRYVR
jgi:hypothetical protein